MVVPVWAVLWPGCQEPEESGCSRFASGHVGAEGGAGDGRPVLVGELLLDRRGGDLRVRYERRVDAAVQGGRLSVDLLPLGRIG